MKNDFDKNLYNGNKIEDRYQLLQLGTSDEVRTEEYTAYKGKHRSAALEHFWPLPGKGLLHPK